MKKFVIILSAVAFVGGFLIFYNAKPASSPTSNNSDISKTSQNWESKIDEQAGVTVTVTPTILSIDSNEWKFDVVLNTHSVELDQDMTDIAVLIDDGGEEYRAIRWEGPGPGGHHREGVLVFETINPMPSHLELKIKNIGEATERSFKWDLE